MLFYCLCCFWHSLEWVVKHCSSLDRFSLYLIHPTLHHCYRSNIFSPQSTERCADISTHKCETKTCGRRNDEVDRQGKWGGDRKDGQKDGNNDNEWMKSSELRNKMRQKEEHVEVTELCMPSSDQRPPRAVGKHAAAIAHHSTNQQLHQNQPVKNKRQNKTLIQTFYMGMKKNNIWSPWKLWAEKMRHTIKMVG